MEKNLWWINENRIGLDCSSLGEYGASHADVGEVDVSEQTISNLEDQCVAETKYLF